MSQQDALDSLHAARDRVAIDREYDLFVKKGIDDPEDPVHPRRNRKDSSDIRHNFFLGLVLRVHVPLGEVWYVYRDGLLLKPLKTGVHVLLNRNLFFTKWVVWRINIRTETLPALVTGYVRGPDLSADGEGSAPSEIALAVKAEFRLLAKIDNIEKFIGFTTPLKVFYNSFNNTVQRLMSELPYDQYGKWAVILRDQLEQELQMGRDNPQDLIGFRIEKVFVDSCEPNSEYDAEQWKLFKLKEKIKRELQDTNAKKEKGKILDLPASLLELVNSDAGREVISGDQKIREMLAALGIKVDLLIPRPYTNEPPSIQPPPLRPSIEPPRKSTYPSIPPTHVYEVPKSEDLNPPLTGEIVTPPLNPPAQPSSPEPLLTQTRLQMELKKIEEAGYVSSGWSKETSQFDKNGQPLPGSVTWSLNVYIERADKYLTIAFHCPTNYPNAAPFVQTSPPGSKELREITPNTVATWHPGRFLVEIVREIDEWQI